MPCALQIFRSFVASGSLSISRSPWAIQTLVGSSLAPLPNALTTGKPCSEQKANNSTLVLTSSIPHLQGTRPDAVTGCIHHKITHRIECKFRLTWCTATWLFSVVCFWQCIILLFLLNALLKFLGGNVQGKWQSTTILGGVPTAPEASLKSRASAASAVNMASRASTCRLGRMRVKCSAQLATFGDPTWELQKMQRKPTVARTKEGFNIWNICLHSCIWKNTYRHISKVQMFFILSKYKNCSGKKC